jgi:hypothetical protein
MPDKGTELRKIKKASTENLYSDNVINKKHFFQFYIIYFDHWTLHFNISNWTTSSYVDG